MLPGQWQTRFGQQSALRPRHTARTQHPQGTLCTARTQHPPAQGPGLSSAAAAAAAPARRCRVAPAPRPPSATSVAAGQAAPQTLLCCQSSSWRQRRRLCVLALRRRGLPQTLPARRAARLPLLAAAAPSVGRHTSMLAPCKVSVSAVTASARSLLPLSPCRCSLGRRRRTAALLVACLQFAVLRELAGTARSRKNRAFEQAEHWSSVCVTLSALSCCIVVL